jgi:hypothetical protein
MKLQSACHRKPKDIIFLLFLVLISPYGHGQVSGQAGSAPPPYRSDTSEGNKRFFHMVPSFGIVRAKTNVPPLSAGEKFKLGANHAFDRVTLLKAALAGAISQADDAPQGYGQGWDAYGKRVAASAGNIGTNELFSTFLFPSLLHQDPRYFLSGAGTSKKRVWYAISRVWVTRNDGGNNAFNSAKILGTFVSAAATNAYYPDRDRTWGGTFKRGGIRLAVSAGTNVLQEFVPELKRILMRKK